MAPLSASTLIAGSTTLTNLSSSRHRPPSLAVQREEGWTEVWGGKDLRADNGDGNGDDSDDDEAAGTVEKPYLPPRYVTVMKDGCDHIGVEDERSDASDRKDPSAMLKLTQHRVAWFEQIVLRMSYIPHVVENSGYAATESTGGLPCILDLSSRERRDVNAERDDAEDDDDVAEWGRAWKKSLSQLDKPVLVGRNQPGGLGSNFFHRSHESCRTTSPSNILNPSWFLPSGSHIVDYLRLKHSHHMKNNLLFHEHLRERKSSGDVMAYVTLVQDKLNYILLALRYGNDPAWEGVYRPQCIRATMDPHGVDRVNASASDNSGWKRKSFFPLLAWYQTYSERTLALHNLLPSAHAMSPSAHGGLAFELFRYNDYRFTGAGESSRSDHESDEDSTEESNVHQHHPFSSFFPSYGGVGGGDSGRVNVHRAMEFASVYYASLEEKLACSHDGGGDALTENHSSEQATFFLGTEKPTYIDALLFAHLAEALCDVHLILVLSKHPHLMRYFQRMYDQYFGEGYARAWKSHSSGRGTVTSVDWIQENNAVNALNAFNQIPEADSSKPASKSVASIVDEGHGMVHAIRLMQQMAVHCNDLQEALRDAAALRAAEGGEKALLQSYQRPIGSKLYRWIMGSDVEFWGSASHIDKSLEAEDDEDAHSHSDDEDGKEPMSEEDEKRERMLRERTKQMKRDRRAQDELWLSGVVATVVVALVISASGKKTH